jgi:hypothetical protein
MHYFSTAYRINVEAGKKILDPNLNELYTWIHKGIIGISMTVVLLSCILIMYFAPPSLYYAFFLLLIISFLIGGCGVILCNLFLYCYDDSKIFNKIVSSEKRAYMA